MCVYEERYQRVLSIIREKKLDGIIVSNKYNMQYLSGFTGGTGYLYLSPNKRIVLTDSRYTVQAKEETFGFEILEIKNDYTELFADIFYTENGKRIGVESMDLLVSTLEKWKSKFSVIEWCLLKEELSGLRAVKTWEELEKIKKAEEIGDVVFSKILNIIKPGITELEVAAHLEFLMKQQGAQGLSFDTIVASGVNSAKPHAVPGYKKIEKGDFVTMDFGCVYEGYCSDMTRTIVVGKASRKQREIYHIVLQAQEEALAFMKAGYTGAQVDKVARDVITRAGYGSNFGHGLGHGVGLYIHENPRLSSGENTVLKENMTETVEPGIYIENFGGVRIEDLVVITNEGCVNYTKSSKEFIEL